MTYALLCTMSTLLVSSRITVLVVRERVPGIRPGSLVRMLTILDIASAMWMKMQIQAVPIKRAYIPSTRTMCLCEVSLEFTMDSMMATLQQQALSDPCHPQIPAPRPWHTGLVRQEAAEVT